jgi:hypothetical protein
MKLFTEVAKHVADSAIKAGVSMCIVILVFVAYVTEQRFEDALSAYGLDLGNRPNPVLHSRSF